MRFLPAMGAAAAVLSAPVGANASNICWVEKVKRTKTGVEVYFIDSRTVFVHGPNGKGQPYTSYSARSKYVYQQDGFLTVEAVPARVGDKIDVFQTHDGCTLIVEVRDGRIGLMGHARTALPGLEPTASDAFIPAE